MEPFEVPLPERMGHGMPLGPFDDPRDLLRFLLLLGLGAWVGFLFGLLYWVPIAGAAALLTLVRIDEETLLTRVGRRVRYVLRRAEPPEPPGRVLLDHYWDPAGSPWEVWGRAPSPISGRSSEELWAEASELLRALALREADAWLIRRPRPWNGKELAATSSAGGDPLEAAYRRWLAATTRGRFAAELWILWSARRDRGAARGWTGSSRALEALGWRRIRGSELQSLVPQLLPVSCGSRP